MGAWKTRRESRNQEQLQEHYEIEKQLAVKLRNASKEERRHLYSALYDELFRRVPSHPLMAKKVSPAMAAESVARQMVLLRRFLRPDAIFLEIGSGDCALSLEVSKFVRQVWAVDVSNEITRALSPPGNFRLLLSDGSSIPLGPETVNVAYSNECMEHLHPDDAAEQIQNIHRVLTSGGAYVCVTPNRLSGPHDISLYFDDEATGLHLKEYTMAELAALMKRSGFRKVVPYAGGRSVYIRVPLFLVTGCEGVLAHLPRRWRKAIASWMPIRALLGIHVVALK